jgi:hypothetical protein
MLHPGQTPRGTDSRWELGIRQSTLSDLLHLSVLSHDDLFPFRNSFASTLETSGVLIRVPFMEYGRIS